MYLKFKMNVSTSRELKYRKLIGNKYFAEERYVALSAWSHHASLSIRRIGDSSNNETPLPLESPPHLHLSPLSYI